MYGLLDVNLCMESMLFPEHVVLFERRKVVSSQVKCGGKLKLVFEICFKTSKCFRKLGKFQKWEFLENLQTHSQ